MNSEGMYAVGQSDALSSQFRFMRDGLSREIVSLDQTMGYQQRPTSCMSNDMLVVTVVRGDDRCAVKLKGRLTGSWAEDLKCAPTRTKVLEVDLRDVTFVDNEAEETLLRLRRMGARFQGEGAFARTTRQRVREQLHMGIGYLLSLIPGPQ